MDQRNVIATDRRRIENNAGLTQCCSPGCAQVRHLGIAQDVPNEENRHIRLVGHPVTLSRTPSSMVARPPEFGEQTEDVLSELGFTADEIGALRQCKVV
jgi:crotonobetainyl-CoA:carnitine CoA-transferase CaiB-like acyl-CoA transferase